MWTTSAVAATSRRAGRARQAPPALRPTFWEFLRTSPPSSLLSVPVIYSMLAPIALLDLWITIYQRLCFPLFGIPGVVRGDHVVVDRHRLPYLTWIEKVNCAYCGYANGVFAYAREIGARTEQYWCPIKHARAVPAPHDRYAIFVDYDDAAGYRRDLEAIRKAFPRASHRGPAPRHME